MFDKQFYPTPRHVIERMGIDCYDKVCLEPSAGKGDIVDYLKEFGARKVIACELNEHLRKIVSHKAMVIGDDFLKVTPDQVSHVDLIVMNPPFLHATRHILHAWEIAPEGCEIIALCNWETVKNTRFARRQELGAIVNDYGSKENLGDCFLDAERTTGVEVGLIHLFKPVVSESFDWDGFYYTSDEEVNGNGIISYNEIRALVNSYVAAVKCFDRFEEIQQEMNGYTSIVKFGSGLSFSVSRGEDITDKDTFSKELQRHCWKVVFRKMNMEKYVTQGVMEDINKFIEGRLNYPFTMRNIHRMLEIIVGTRGNIMNRAIVEAIDKFTMHTHENRYSVEGWKTNSGHLLNKKFIVGWISEIGYDGGIKVNTYRSNFDKIRDLTKAICYLTGTNYDEIPDINIKSEGERQNYSTNTWYPWGFFEFKLFKKGTGHFKFKDEKVWEQLNRTYAKIKGQVLPEKL